MSPLTHTHIWYPWDDAVSLWAQEMTHGLPHHGDVSVSWHSTMELVTRYQGRGRIEAQGCQSSPGEVSHPRVYSTTLLPIFHLQKLSEEGGSHSHGPQLPGEWWHASLAPKNRQERDVAIVELPAHLAKWEKAVVYTLNKVDLCHPTENTEGHS